MSWPVGMESSFSGVGHLRDEMNSKLNQKADSHEIYSLRSNVNSLENSVRELRAEIDGLRFELQQLREARQS